MQTTLYLNNYGLSLKKESECFNIFQQGKRIRVIPAIQVGQIVVSTEAVSITGGAIRLCMAHQIPIFFLLNRNDAESYVLSPSECLKPELQLLQIQCHCDIHSIFSLAGSFIKGKIKNQLSLMKYFHNSRRQKNKALEIHLSEQVNTVKHIIHEINSSEPIPDVRLMRDRLMSAEGRASAAYWKSFASLIPESFAFPSRVRRGATDPVNCLLNYGYAILRSKVHHAVLKNGLSTHFSFLHSPQPNRPNLVLDLMEEFRPWMVDRVVLSMIGKHFHPTLDEENKLNLHDRKQFIEHLEARWKKDNLIHLIDSQVKQLIQAIKQRQPYKPIVFQVNTGKIS